jgi:hypothetical protein
VLLTLFDWGQRWFASNSTHAQVFHKACGEPLRVIVTCAHCRETVKAMDVRVLQPAGAEPRPAERMSGTRNRSRGAKTRTAPSTRRRARESGGA